jgi:hypothetical protein
MIAAMLKDDVQDTGLKGQKWTVWYSSQIGNAISDDCRHSSKTLAQALQYATDTMGMPVAMGSDFNGIAGHTGPRFGSDACGGWEPVRSYDREVERVKQEVQKNQVAYPFSLPGFGTFDRQQTGLKQFDFNVDGLAHIGLLPDLVQDLTNIGLDSYYMDQLMCSAEQYIRVWEKAEAIATNSPLPDPNAPWNCGLYLDSEPPVTTATVTPDAGTYGWYNQPMTVLLQATDDSAVESISYTATGATADSGTLSAAGVSLVFSAEGTTSLEFFATDIAGNVEQPANMLSLMLDLTIPAIEGSAAPQANAAGWNNSDVTVSFNCSDTLSGILSCEPDHVLASDGAGQSVTGTATDKAENSSTAAVSGINLDKTSPAITGMRSPVANAQGWNNGPVNVSFACFDVLSGVDSCGPDTSVTAEGAGQSVSGATTDVAGNGPVPAIVADINIDLTKPTINGSASPPANAAGWNNSDVTVSFSCSDALSGILSCEPDHVLAGDGAGRSVIGTATDNAGNSDTATVSGINLDKTGPEVEVTGVSDGATYTLGAVPDADCDTSDALSGVATAATVNVSGGTANNVGTFTATCSGAKDVAGNDGQASVTYTVHYDFSGFLSPVDNPPIINSAKAGQTIPVKFSLHGDHGLDILAGAPTSALTGCDAGAPIDEIEEVAGTAGNSGLNYDAASDQYSYMWKTAKSWAGSCRVFSLWLDDGAIHMAKFSFH